MTQRQRGGPSVSLLVTLGVVSLLGFGGWQEPSGAADLLTGALGPQGVFGQARADSWRVGEMMHFMAAGEREWKSGGPRLIFLS